MPVWPFRSAPARRGIPCGYLPTIEGVRKSESLDASPPAGPRSVKHSLRGRHLSRTGLRPVPNIAQHAPEPSPAPCQPSSPRSLPDGYPPGRAVVRSAGGFPAISRAGTCFPNRGQRHQGLNRDGQCRGDEENALHSLAIHGNSLLGPGAGAKTITCGSLDDAPHPSGFPQMRGTRAQARIRPFVAEVTGASRKPVPFAASPIWARRK